MKRDEETWGDMRRCDETQKDIKSNKEPCRDVKRDEETWGDMKRHKETQKDM